MKLKAYQATLYIFSESETESIKMCCINIQLNIDLPSLNKYSTFKLLYMTVTHYQNKMLYNKLVFSTNYTDLLMHIII